MTDSLHQQAQQFAEELTATVQAVVGPRCPAFTAAVLEGGDAFSVRQEPREGVVLLVEGEPLLRLEVDFQCVLDGHDRFLAVEKSEIHVFVEPEGRQPLFRYEYVRRMSSTVPAAHIQFHGVHPDLEKLMVKGGTRTRRSKKRRKGGQRIMLSDLHFPVGGSRFRPCLEDVMEMLIEEFAIDTVQEVKAARAALAESREAWRRRQVATVVRDAPSEAVRVLKELGYQIELPPDGVHPDKPEKLRAL